MESLEPANVLSVGESMETPTSSEYSAPGMPFEAAFAPELALDSERLRLHGVLIFMFSSGVEGFLNMVTWLTNNSK